MKKLMTGVMLAGLAAFVGCNAGNTGGRPGGTGAPASHGGSGSHNPMEGHKGGFSLKVDKWTKETLKQGETDKVPLAISRDSDFHDDVKLSADNVPTGLKVTIDPPAFKGSEDTSKKVDLTVHADDSAAVGDHSFNVVGTPMSGNPYTLPVKVKVVAKDSKK